ncbi:MAG: 2-hydroxyacid dehydrogenase, partial [Acetobacteraceae bacterium]
DCCFGRRAVARCRSIVFLGTGASSYIDMEAARALDIRVRTIRGYGDRSVAEHAFALILAASRRVAEMDQALRAGVWEPLEGVELEGKTLGIIGTGGTGRALAHLAAGFGMQVLAWNRSPTPADLPGRSVGLDALLGRSDIVSLHLALTPETRGIIDARRLQRLRPHAVFVNTARAGLVDTGALIEVLRQRRIAHAALDVFDAEPLPPDHALTKLDNVTLTSHAGFKTPEASRRLALTALGVLQEDLAALADGRAIRP